MEELIGFVTGNKNRQKLLALLGSRHEMNADLLARNMHIARPSADRIIGELVDKGLIMQDSDSYRLTELGESLERKMQSI